MTVVNFGRYCSCVRSKSRALQKLQEVMIPDLNLKSTGSLVRRVCSLQDSVWSRKARPRAMLQGGTYGVMSATKSVSKKRWDLKQRNRKSCVQF